MEELRSTEVLDREILEDARKKAFKVLKTADDTLEAQKRDWEKKTSAELDSIRSVYAEKTKKTGDEIIARLPLDKRRLRSKITEEFLSGAMGNFLRLLRRETLLDILERELRARLEIIAGDGEAARRAEVRYSGLTLAETRSVLEKVSVPKDWEMSNWNFRETSRGADMPGGGGFPALVIDTQAFRITASVENTAALLLQDKRAELAAALLGEEALND